MSPSESSSTEWGERKAIIGINRNECKINKHIYIYIYTKNAIRKKHIGKAIHQWISIVFECYVPLKSENL